MNSVDLKASVSFVGDGSRIDFTLGSTISISSS